MREIRGKKHKIQVFFPQWDVEQTSNPISSIYWSISQVWVPININFRLFASRYADQLYKWKPTADLFTASPHPYARPLQMFIIFIYVCMYNTFILSVN